MHAPVGFRLLLGVPHGESGVDGLREVVEHSTRHLDLFVVIAESFDRRPRHRPGSVQSAERRCLGQPQLYLTVGHFDRLALKRREIRLSFLTAHLAFDQSAPFGFYSRLRINVGGVASQFLSKRPLTVLHLGLRTHATIWISAGTETFFPRLLLLLLGDSNLVASLEKTLVRELATARAIFVLLPQIGWLLPLRPLLLLGDM
jgi:hypothetical protein